jgi:DNA-binding NarL/FixJ family response regulator
MKKSLYVSGTPQCPPKSRVSDHSLGRETMLTTVGIVEDNRDFRATLARYVDEAPGHRCVCACSTSEEALQKIPRLLPDVVLMDVHLPQMSGLDCTRRLKELCPSVQILILTVYEDNERIFGALKAGAAGYLLKRADPADILSAIQDVKQGGAPMSSQIARRVVQSFRENSREPARNEKLSHREEEILQQLSKGYSTKEIADCLSVSTNTVRTHLQHIYEKLHVRSRTEAVVKFLH